MGGEGKGILLLPSPLEALVKVRFLEIGIPTARIKEQRRVQNKKNLLHVPIPPLGNEDIDKINLNYSKAHVGQHKYVFEYIKQPLRPY